MQFTIKGELCDLNTYINAERRNRFIASKIKKEQTETIAWQVKALRLPPVDNFPVDIELFWFTKNLKKDCDNVTFSKKFLLDGFVLAGLIANDNRKHIHLVTDIGIAVDALSPRVEVSIIPIPPLHTST